MSLNGSSSNQAMDALVVLFMHTLWHFFLTFLCLKCRPRCILMSGLLLLIRAIDVFVLFPHAGQMCKTLCTSTCVQKVVRVPLCSLPGCLSFSLLVKPKFCQVMGLSMDQRCFYKLL